MPDHRLARTRSGYEGYVYQPPQSRTVQAVAAKWLAQYEPEPHVHEQAQFDIVMLQSLCVCGAWRGEHPSYPEGWQTGSRFDVR